MHVSNLIKSAALGGVFILPMTVAQAADGCKFLLCMGAVNPMGVAECASTVKEVMRDLAKGKSLPTCNLVSGADSKSTGNYVTHNRASYIPPCPDGTHYGSKSTYYHKGTRTNTFAGGYKSSFTQDDRRTKYNSRVCVGGQKYAAASTKRRVDGSIVNERHEWWEKVETVKPDNAKYEFFMFVDGQPYSNHRF